MPQTIPVTKPVTFQVNKTVTQIQTVPSSPVTVLPASVTPAVTNNIHTVTNSNIVIPIQTMATTPLKPFDGSGSISGTIWLSNFESWKGFNNINDDRALHALKGAMEGSAATWHFNMPNENTDTVEKFKTEFLKRFEANNASKLFALKQEQNENASLYVNRVEKLSVGSEFPEYAVVELAIKGLNAKLKVFVLGHQPKTWSALRHALDIANQQMDCEAQTNQAHQINLLQSQEKQPAPQQPPFQHHYADNQQNYQQPMYHQSYQQPNHNYGYQHQPMNRRQPFNNQRRQSNYNPRQSNYNPRQQQRRYPEYPGCQGCGKSCQNRFECPANNMSCAYCFKPHHIVEACRELKSRGHPSDPNFQKKYQFYLKAQNEC